MDWRVKACAQALLSAVPGGRSINFALQKMLGTFDMISIRGTLRQGLRMVRVCREQGLDVDGSVIVEIGTGWHPALPLLLSCLGAKEVITYDIARLVNRHLALITLKQLIASFPEICEDTGIARPILDAWRTTLDTREDVPSFLRSARIRYVAPGDAARTGLPNASVDLVFSHGVLEHVPRDTVDVFLRESYRILKPSGLMYHRIGLHDHYVAFDKAISMVNFLKYSDRAWRFLGQSRLHYQNRLRCSEFLQLIRDRGLRLLWHDTRTDHRSLQALSHIRVAERFMNLSPEDLATHVLMVLASKPEEEKTPRECAL